MDATDVNIFDQAKQACKNSLMLCNTSVVTDVRMGVWKHWKGPLYQVIGLAHDANHPGRICVAYIGLQLDGAHFGPRLKFRTLEDFLGHVDANGVTIPAGAPIEDLARVRFRYLGPELTAEMIT